MDTLNLIKTIVEMATNLITALFPPLKLFLDAHSDTSEKMIQSVREVSAMMESPIDRDKIDVERLRAFADLAGKMAPFAWTEYAYFVTKVVIVMTFMIYIAKTWPFGRLKSIER